MAIPAAKNTATIDFGRESSARFTPIRACVQGLTIDRMRTGRCSFRLTEAFELSKHVDAGIVCANIFVCSKYVV